MTTRRRFVAALPALLGGLSWQAQAQPGGTPRRVALLLPADVPTEAPFRATLAALGYVEGHNLATERRSAGNDFGRLPALAAELVGSKPDVIVSFLTQASIAAKQATATIPIVVVGVGDPVASGLVANLARPGGNVTGTAGQVSQVIGKQLELVRELRPGAARIAALWNPANVVFQSQSVDVARTAAARLGMRLDLVEARTQTDLRPRLAEIAARRPDAVLVFGEPLFVANAARLAELLLTHRLPAIGGSRAYADAGMLATYAPDLAESARRAAHCVDRILRGTRPADIPVELVAKFELVVNLRTAAALGVTIAPALLARADALIR
ncbi:MAG TPA: ABC transporter substrate-binding protein [Casimicrobiaceae bacterium]